MIRPAKMEDASQVAPLLILSMQHIAGIFANSDRYEDAIPFFEAFFKRDDNQYSYAHTLVSEDDGIITGSVTGYDGARLHALRQPVLDEIHKTKPDFMPDDETGPGEFYLDCINVDEKHQGKGIGKKLVAAFCEKAAHLRHSRLGLIVDLGNPMAKKFYENLGFREAGQKRFMGHWYFHMIMDIN